MQIKVNIALPFNMDEVNSGKQQDDYNIIIAGGEGIGIVTMPGLGLELGAPAITHATQDDRGECKDVPQLCRRA